MDEVRILFISAAPRDSDYPNIPMEREEIIRNIDRSPRLILQNGGEIRRSYFSELLLREAPHIVHFSGHGSRFGIVLLNDTGEGEVLTNNALSSIFDAIIGNSGTNLQLIFFNSCDSTDYAVKIANVVGCSIGVNGKIEDKKAIMFSTMFYRNIAFGLSIKKAFELSRTDTWPNGSPAGQIGWPELHVRKGVDADQIRPVPQLFKGYILLEHPSLWNNCAIVINITRQTLNIFLSLYLYHIDPFIRDLDRKIKSNGIADIKDSQASWQGYCNVYQRLIDDYNRMVEPANKAFSELLNVNNVKLRDELNSLYQYYMVSANDITAYKEKHKTITSLINGEQFLRSKNARPEVLGEVCTLSDKARGLLTISDELLKGLVNILSMD